MDELLELSETIKKLFNIEQYNLIQDEENYYLFRALNNGDHNDMQNGITRAEDGTLTYVRTDRDRYIENPENGVPKYGADDDNSLIQVIDHIKRGHRIDTNCISLSSNANVSVIYGNGNYHDEYVVIKVPKDKMGDKIINASEYMLSEMLDRIQDTIQNIDNDEVKDLIHKIIATQSLDELMEIVVNSYGVPQVSEEQNERLTAPAGEFRSRAPIKGRYSKHATLSSEQNLLKNKVIAMLTILEERNLMNPIIPHSRLDTTAIRTLGMAISSSEILHHGEIHRADENGEQQLFEVSKDIMHMLGLLQQVAEKRPELIDRVHQIENNLLQRAMSGELIYDVNNEIESEPQIYSIEQAYELSNGKIQYDDMQKTIDSIFYLSKSIMNARLYAQTLNRIMGNNAEYADVIHAISTMGIDVSPKLMNKVSSSEYQVCESVRIPLMDYEEGLIEDILGRESSELARITNVEEHDIEHVKDIIGSLNKLQGMPSISKDEYYARAVYSLYNWEEQHIKFTLAHKEKFIKKLKGRQIAKIYETIFELGIDKDEIPKLIMNLIMLADQDASDVSEKSEIYKSILDGIEQGNITGEIIAQLKDENSDLRMPINVAEIEDYLDFYKVEGTDIRLRDYQQNAIDNVSKIFEKHRFATVVLPTGAGKSFVALAELQAMKKITELMNLQNSVAEAGTNGKILYLAPSQEILNQIMKYTEIFIHGEKLEKSREDIFKEIFPNVELATYQSLLTKTDEELKSMKYSFIVLDELHRTGAEKWGEKLKVLLESQDESTKVLGLTATPERDSDARNMADEMAELFGYTHKEIKQSEHIAKKMDLLTAIRLGIVVAPKIVECDYNLKNDIESWKSLQKTIDDMDDGPDKEAYRRKYDELRAKVENAKGIPELFRDSIVKKDGRYIFYMPIGANDYVEDEEGNIIGTKTGEEKIRQAQEQLKEWLKYVDAEPEFYSMLGSYGDTRNTSELNAFEDSKSEHIKIMVVMNKLNEGVHARGVNGIIWQRALDENSRTLLLQQLGRAIYAPKEGQEISDEDRPVVIDLANNLSRVDLNKVLNTYTEEDDIILLKNILEWIEENDGILPDINSQFREEARLAVELKRIQGKYVKYNKKEEFEHLDFETAEIIGEILDMGSEIDLWDIELPDRIANKSGNKGRNGKDVELEEFIVEGVAKEFADFVSHIDKINARNAVEKFIIKLSILKRFGIDTSKIITYDTIETLARKARIRCNRSR